MNFQSFDMNLLKVLNTLLEERSVTRTGERLGRTQSAISNSLRNLREAFDDPLLVRGAGGLEPTPLARRIEGEIREIIRLTDQCLNGDAAFDPASATGRFQIGAPDRLSLPLMLPLLKTLRSAAPEMTIDARTVDREQGLDMLDNEHMDLAVGWFDSPPGRFNAELMFEERLVGICQKNHSLVRRRKKPALDDILSWPHLVVSAAGDQRGVFDVMLGRVGAERRTAISLSGFTMAAQFLRDSDLVGVFTERMAKLLARENGLALFPLPPEIEPLAHYMVWHRRDDADEKHRWFREQVKSACGEP